MFGDFHTHSLFSDGVLIPVELARRALMAGYKYIAITDHCGYSSLEHIIPHLIKDCNNVSARWDIIAIPGIELTHIPAEDINKVAKRAKELGVKLVVVHGETIVEPVEPGTNRAALQSKYVDILAHPGLISFEDAQLAAANGTFLELSTRQGHSLTNGHVANMARQTGAKLILNSDSHRPEDLLTPAFATAVAQGAGLSKEELHLLSVVNPLLLIQKINTLKTGI